MVRPLSHLCAAALLLPLVLTAALADETEGFSEGPNGAMQHGPSGFVCPAKIGAFERDAVGRRNPKRDSDYCAYSALSGVYGTIVILPLPSTFDPKDGLADEFALQEGTGGTVIGETIRQLGAPGASLPVYLRTYENAQLEAAHYRTLFANAAVGAWSIQVIVEYVDPRDREVEREFLDDVYSAAQRELGGAPTP